MRRRSSWAAAALLCAAGLAAGCATTSAPGPSAIDRAVDAASARCGCRMGIAAKHLESGRAYARLADADFETASVIKIAVLTEAIAEARLFDGVAVELGDVLRDQLTARVVPRAVADPIARVDRARTLRAQIRVPGRGAAAGRGRELLAVGVGAREAAVVRAVTLADARDEERHRLRRRALTAAALTAAALRRCGRRPLLRDDEVGPGEDRHRQRDEKDSQSAHRSPLDGRPKGLHYARRGPKDCRSAGL